MMVLFLLLVGDVFDELVIENAMVGKINTRENNTGGDFVLWKLDVAVISCRFVSAMLDDVIEKRRTG